MKRESFNEVIRSAFLSKFVPSVDYEGIMKLSELGKKKNGSSAPATQKKVAKKGLSAAGAKKKASGGEQKGRRTTLPYVKVAKLWADGKTVTEISHQLGLHNPKAEYPDSTAYGMLNRLRKGVNVDGKEYTIAPRGRGKKKGGK